MERLRLRCPTGHFFYYPKKQGFFNGLLVVVDIGLLKPHKRKRYIEHNEVALSV